MDVATVTTSDRSLLHAVRDVLSSAEEAFLCVAFVQEKGVHLLQKELEALRRRKARSRLLVTTTFQTTSQSALSFAHGLGLDVRVLNPGSGSTFHPKLYLAANGGAASAVIGSANLTGGLATNLEAAAATSSWTAVCGARSSSSWICCSRAGYLEWIAEERRGNRETVVGAIIVRKADPKLRYAVKANERLSLWEFDERSRFGGSRRAAA